MTDIAERLLNIQDHGHKSLNNLHQQAATEINRLRQLLSEADKREREARAKALEEAAQVAERTSEPAPDDEHIGDDCWLSRTSANARSNTIAALIRALQSEER